MKANANKSELLRTILALLMSAALMLTMVACAYTKEKEEEPEPPEETVEEPTDDGGGEESAEPGGTETPSGGSEQSMPDAPSGGATDYDVMKDYFANSYQGVKTIYFNDFMMIMPDNEKWSFEPNGNSVSFYLFSAQQEGYGGRLVTIQAYDIDDETYKELPMPHCEAGVGRNVNKRFIAIYPSDVQYDFNNAEQSADYQELYDYLLKIGENAVDSPLQTSDSDPQ